VLVQFAYKTWTKIFFTRTKRFKSVQIYFRVIGFEQWTIFIIQLIIQKLTFIVSQVNSFSGKCGTTYGLFCQCPTQKFPFIWTTECDVKLLFWAKPFPQIEQINGFSPVWILICRFNIAGTEHAFPHIGQMWDFLGLCRMFSWWNTGNIKKK
jgi:hypothetical protein